MLGAVGQPLPAPRSSPPTLGNTSRQPNCVATGFAQISAGEVLRQLHDNPTVGHLGENKTLDKVRQRFYWAKCSADVRDWCKRCEVCARKKGPGRRKRSPLQRYDVGCPMERIALDVMGPFPETDAGNKYILVILDYFTKRRMHFRTMRHALSPPCL